ncbi:hypothetical protein HRbin36_01651 [bacterium HR36]|nr:hypothetical protein HRbin36_01651 [bacterium HR36]
MRTSSLLALLSAVCLAPVLAAQDKKPAASERPCVFTVLVPPTAHLEVEGYPTKSRGEIRLFESPPMPSGKTYVYTIRAIHGGIVVTRTLEVSPDKPAELDLRPDFGIQVPATPKATPKPKTPETVEPKPPVQPSTKPPEQKPSKPAAPPSFTLGGIRDVMLAAGGTATVRLTVERKNLDGLIQLTFANLPRGVTVNQSTIPAGANSIDLIFRAAPGIPGGKHPVTLKAQAVGAQQTAKFSIIVVEELSAKPIIPAKAKPVSPAPSKSDPPAKPTGVTPSSEITHSLGFLQVSGPQLVTLAPGHSAKLLFRVVRQNVRGPVHFQWTLLPKGVNAPSASLKETDDQVVLSLSAAADAAPVAYEAVLEVATAGGAIRLEIPIRLEIR